MKKETDTKTLAKKVLDMYFYNHISINLAIATITNDINTAIKIKEYIKENL